MSSEFGVLIFENMGRQLLEGGRTILGSLTWDIESAASFLFEII